MSWSTATACRRERAEQVPIVGEPARAAERLVEYLAAGVDRLALGVFDGDWYRQTELLAEARAMLD